MTKIAVIGLGYVGLNLAVAFAKDYEVIGFDVDKKRIQQLDDHFDRYNSVSLQDLEKAKIQYSSDEACLEKANFYIIAVPTPAGPTHEPELDFLEVATHSIGKYLKKNDVVVNESTVYPGATEEICIPILEKESGLRSGIDFFVGYSPERINPGDEAHGITKVQKIISGQNPQALEKIKEVYANLTSGGLYIAENMKTAEAVKVFENTQRDVNIALLNEFVQLTTALNIDIYSVIEALKTKWNYLNFAPGFVGGHCISVDPYYLTYKARKIGLEMRLIETARQVNNNLTFLIQDILVELVKNNHNLKEASVAVFGLTYKEDVPDYRDSLSIDLVKALRSRCSLKVYASDPFLGDLKLKEMDFELTDFNDLPQVSAIVITKADSAYKKMGFKNFSEKLQKNGCIFDLPGIFRKESLPRPDIHYKVY